MERLLSYKEVTMNRRNILVIVLVICLMISSCRTAEIEKQPDEVNEVSTTETESVDTEQNNTEVNQTSTPDNTTNDKEEDQEADQETTESSDQSIEEALSYVGGWDIPYIDMSLTVPYEGIEYTPMASSYALGSDLSNLYNAGQYDGFTDNQLKMIQENGFVVLKHRNEYPDNKLHHGYESAEYMDYPVFITSDIVLHMYRSFYSESMKTLELTYYLEDLKKMSQNLLTQVEFHYKTNDTELNEQLKYVYAYIAIGNRLLGYEVDVPEEVASLVEQELANIADHKALSKSVLYGKDVDYSQYTVRGHYTLHEDLSKFFRAMMWYGQTGFQLTREDQPQFDEIAKANMLSHLILENEDNVNYWTNIYNLTKLYSGYADDLTVYDMKDLIEDVYGLDQAMEVYIDSVYKDALIEAMVQLRQPKIQAEVVNEAIDMPKGLQYRLMGQRFTLDAYIMQNLMKPILRPVPTAFDVLSAFEHPRAEEVLYEYYKTNEDWPEYDAKLGEMKAYVADFTEDEWKSDLYHGWLWSINQAATSYEDTEGMPEFMQTEAWSYKNLASALGSYTELKHDNVLYAKQPVAEMGGEFYEVNEYHYVEPNVELYNQLLWLAQYTQLNLEANPDIDPAFIEPLLYMVDLLETLRTVSIKELEGTFVTNEEMNKMSSIGGYIDYLNFVYGYQLYEKGIQVDNPVTSALVTDVATITDGYYVEEATGIPYEIYVVCQVNGLEFMAKGMVYSYYEFLSDERLTNESWAEMIGYRKDPDWGMLVYEGPGLDMIEMMPWSKAYISDEANNIRKERVELVWGDE